MTTVYRRPVDDDRPIVVEQRTDNAMSIWSIVHLVLAVFALYLSFKCNQGFNLLSFLAALCCPYLYIPYILATKDSTCPGPIFGNFGSNAQSGQGFY